MMTRFLMTAAAAAALFVNGCASTPRASDLNLSATGEPTMAEIAMASFADADARKTVADEI